MVGKFPSFASRHPTPTLEPKSAVLPPAIARREVRPEQVVQVRSNVVAAPQPAGAGCCGKNPKKQLSDSLLSRTVQYAKALAKHLSDDMTEILSEDLKFREKCCSFCVHNVEDKCILCNCPLKENLLNKGKLAWRSETCPAGRWFRQTDLRRPLENSTRDLIFHIYPKIGCEWNWEGHIQRIKDNSYLFKRIIIGIVHDRTTVSPDVVQEKFKDISITDWVIKPNKTMPGETVTFLDMLELVNSDDPNNICLYGHTKGVKHPQNSVMQLWADVMWETCLDLPSVENALASHLMAGSFKRYQPLHKSKWHYSGTFFWFRSADIFKRNWKNVVNAYAGTEGWPGSIVSSDEAACLFHDHCGPLYERKNKYWETEVEAEVIAWKAARNK